MSDYNPDPGRYGRYDYRDPDPGSGRAGYVLLAVLAAVALVGGFLYFGNPENRGADQQAQAPDRTTTAPQAPGAGGTPTTPMTPRQTPAPGQTAPKPQE